MNRRALLIALVIAALGVVLLFVYLRRFEAEASGGEPVKLLTALRPIQAGTAITDDMLATRVVPRAYVEDRAVLESERSKVIGLRVGQTIQAQQTLMWTDLAIAMEERRNLSALVQPGMRAVSVRVSKSGSDDTAFSLIRPGDRIDVVATMASTEKQEQRNAIVLLQNVLVLAVGIDTGSDPLKQNTNDRKEYVLSLSLNLPETQLLALAAEKGNLTVALRNPTDVRVTEGLSEINTSALTDQKIRREITGIRRPNTAPVKIGGDERQVP